MFSVHLTCIIYQNFVMKLKITQKKAVLLKVQPLIKYLDDQTIVSPYASRGAVLHTRDCNSTCL